MTTFSAGAAGSSFAHQPSTGPRAPKIRDRRRYIHFFGEGYQNPQNTASFDVLAGDTGPQVTGGYAQWQTVQRPLQRSLTVFQGYDPSTLQIPIRFFLSAQDGSWLTDDSAGAVIEQQISNLEWMAGALESSGMPPLVYLSTYDNSGNTIPLIPWGYQSDTPSVSGYPLATFPWVITSLQWGDAIRNADQARIRQDATVTVQFFVPPKGTSSAQAPRSKAYTVVSNNAADTALLIARGAIANNAPVLALAIVSDSRNANLRLRSVNQMIKHGRKVWVPDSAQV